MEWNGKDGVVDAIPHNVLGTNETANWLMQSFILYIMQAYYHSLQNFLNSGKSKQLTSVCYTTK